MAGNELIPFKEPADRVTCTPTAAVVGKTFVSISGDKNADGTYSIAPTPAGGKAFGVACWDAAIGVRVTVITLESRTIVPVQAGAAIAAGASVVADAAAKAITAVPAVAGAVVNRASGIAVTGAAINTDAQILLTRHVV